jgi:hypothetical protein
MTMLRFYLRKRALEEQESRRHKSSTFTEPLKRTPDMEEFLAEFYKNIYTDQQHAIYRQEKDQYPILKNHFDILVPGIISFEDFWQRYDYRCNVERIMMEMKEQNSQSISKSLGSVRQRIIDMASEVKTTIKEDTASETHQGTAEPMPEQDQKATTVAESAEMNSELNQEATTKENTVSETNQGTAETMVERDQNTRTVTEVAEPNSELNQEALSGGKKEEQPPPTEPQPLEEPQQPFHQQEASVTSDGIESQSEVSVEVNPAVHVYPESPEIEDEESRASLNQTPPDDRLVGTAIYLLNDIDDDIAHMIKTLGGSLTNKLEDATHAVWISNPERECTSCVDASMAASLSIPIVDADLWLPRMSNLQWDEHWSDINCNEFLPISTEASLQPRNLGEEEQELLAILVEPKQQVQRAKKVVQILVFLVAVLLAMSNLPSSVNGYCSPARPGTFLALFCAYAGPVPEQLEELKTPWWKKVGARIKKKGRKNRIQ